MASFSDMSALATKLNSILGPAPLPFDPSSLQPADPSTVECSLVLKVISDLRANSFPLRDSLAAIWRPRGPLEFKEMGPNFFRATFSSRDEASRILRSGPWMFGKDFIAMQRSKPLATPDSYVFSSIDLWVHITGIPFELVTPPNLQIIFAPFGEVKTFGVEEQSKAGEFVRAKIAFPLDQPLIGSIAFPLPRHPNHTLRLCYEKLLRYCAFCGRLGHDDSSCGLLEELDMKLHDEDTPDEVKVILKQLQKQRLPFDLRAPVVRPRSSPSTPISKQGSPTPSDHSGPADGQPESGNGSPSFSVCAGYAPLHSGPDPHQLDPSAVSDRVELSSPDSEITRFIRAQFADPLPHLLSPLATSALALRQPVLQTSHASPDPKRPQPSTNLADVVSSPPRQQHPPIVPLQRNDLVAGTFPSATSSPRTQSPLLTIPISTTSMPSSASTGFLCDIFFSRPESSAIPPQQQIPSILASPAGVRHVSPQLLSSIGTLLPCLSSPTQDCPAPGPHTMPSPAVVTHSMKTAVPSLPRSAPDRLVSAPASFGLNRGVLPSNLSFSASSPMVGGQLQSFGAVPRSKTGLDSPPYYVEEPPEEGESENGGSLRRRKRASRASSPVPRPRRSTRPPSRLRDAEMDCSSISPLLQKRLYFDGVGSSAQVSKARKLDSSNIISSKLTISSLMEAEPAFGPRETR